MSFAVFRFASRSTAVPPPDSAPGAASAASSRPSLGAFKLDSSSLTKEMLSQVIPSSFPLQMDFEMASGKKIPARIQYTYDSELQEAMEKLFRQYSPDYGAMVAMDASTGAILAILSYARDPAFKENLAVRATFPSASVFKVVTAAAAIEAQRFSADTVIPYSGRNHTLYRSHVFETRENRWTRRVTLKEAFAKSINTVFGKIGAFRVGSDELREYASRFGFNRKINADFHVDPGSAPIPEDAWGLAESASGFTRDNTMSPLQGALIASSIANYGVLMEPYLVQSIYETSEGKSLYHAQRKVASMTVGLGTAHEMRELMQETVLRGTSRKAFHGFFRRNLAGVVVGGKTGSLTGTSPPGKYDWFIGFAESGSRRIAVSILTVNEKQWRVKSSYLARRAFEVALRSHLTGQQVASWTGHDPLRLTVPRE